MIRRALLTAVLISLATVSLSRAQQLDNFATSKINMVATVNPLATDAAVNAFRKGGNAVDAAIAAAVTLGVVDGYNSGIGGGCFILIRKADGEVIAIDGREMAPAAADRDMYIKNGKVDSLASRVGPLAIGVPGALKAYAEAISNHGNLKLADVMLPAAKIAEQGFEVSTVYSDTLKSQQQKLKRFPATARILLKDDGAIYLPGEKILQADLAKTYRSIAAQGIEWFYNGSFAEKTALWMKSNSGIITEADFARYETAKRQPVQSTYRGYEIIGFPPPSSGGVHVAQILNILESFDLKKMQHDDPAQLKHVVAEAMKLAFADRAYWLGDPNFVNVPKQLISKEYAKSLASKIDVEKSTLVKSHGTPPNADVEFFEKHTTHLTTADNDGNWVAITTTVNTQFGSKVIIPETGVVMNNQMDDFSISIGVPNAYGLVGSENNSIAAGKRPLSSMSPTVVLKNGQPVLAVGAAGGPKIITQVVWAIINHLDLGFPIHEAIGRARVHHQWSPDQLFVEETTSDAALERLKTLGHTLQILKSNSSGVSQAISFDPKTGLFTGAHDPRVPGKAAGQ